MARRARDPRKTALIKEMLTLYEPKTAADIGSMLKDMFSDTIEEMLQAELGSELGYEKHDQGEKSTTIRRNGSYPKTVYGNLGEMEINVPRDREGKYEPIYTAINEDEAESELRKMNENWKSKHQSAVRVWNDNFEYVRQLFQYTADIRRLIYTTNTVESFNSQLRKVANGKGAFPNKQAAMKILYLRTMDIQIKRTRPIPNWGEIREKLDILWGFWWDD